MVWVDKIDRHALSWGRLVAVGVCFNNGVVRKYTCAILTNILPKVLMHIGGWSEAQFGYFWAHLGSVAW